MTKDFRGKNVLITGGAGGIGYFTAKEFAKAGSKIIITDIDQKALETVKKKLSGFGSNIYIYQIDVSNEKEVNKMLTWVKKEFGTLSVLINNAGIAYSAELVQTPIKKWKELIDINIMGPLYHIYAFLPLMIDQEEGQIVNIASGKTYFRLPTWGAYSSTKIAMGAISEILHFELKKFNINVTTVYPYMVNTNLYKNIKANTFAKRLLMKFLPYYSQSPEKVAKTIFDAVRKEKAVEMVSVLSNIAFITRVFPPIANIVSTTALLLLGKDVEDLRDELYDSI